MKKLIIIVSIFYLLISGCTSNKGFSREKAFQLLQRSKSYPQVIDYDIYCGDPSACEKSYKCRTGSTMFINTVQRTQKSGEIGSALIHFTDKAKSYLLPTPEGDRSSNIQKVKLADKELIEVTGIKTGQSGKML